MTLNGLDESRLDQSQSPETVQQENVNNTQRDKASLRVCCVVGVRGWEASGPLNEASSRLSNA